jgi:hypothetical protein
VGISEKKGMVLYNPRDLCNPPFKFLKYKLGLKIKTCELNIIEDSSFSGQGGCFVNTDNYFVFFVDVVCSQS